MKTYWDLTEAERAALTRDDVAKFIDAELMVAGVLKPAPLVLVDVPRLEIAKTTFYQVENLGHRYGSANGVAFLCEGDARAFLALRPVEVGSDWQIGSEYRFSKPLGDSKIVAIDLASEASIEAARATLKEINAANNENDQRRRAFEEQSRKIEQTLKGLWDDWHECVRKDVEMKRVAETFREYIEITRGDHATASAFLRKAFPGEKIAEAEKWTGTRMTYDDTTAAIERADDEGAVF